MSATSHVALQQPLWPRADGTPGLLERQVEGLQTTSTVGILPAISCPPLPEKRPCSNRLQKKCKIEQSEHRILTTTEDNRCSTCSGKVRVEKCSHETVLLIFRASHFQTQTAHSSHHCLKIRENTTEHRTQFSPLSSVPRKCHEPQKKRQVDVQNSQTYHKNMAKTTI